jgi:hypothetical protein
MLVSFLLRLLRLIFVDFVDRIFIDLDGKLFWLVALFDLLTLHDKVNSDVIEIRVAINLEGLALTLLLL